MATYTFTTPPGKITDLTATIGGGGSGAGSAYTTQTWYTPHKITLSKDGYETYKGVVNCDDAKCLSIKLYHNPFKTRIGRE